MGDKDTSGRKRRTNEKEVEKQTGKDRPERERANDVCKEKEG